jgi:hypothetical protein
MVSRFLKSLFSEWGRDDERRHETADRREPEARNAIGSKLNSFSLARPGTHASCRRFAGVWPISFGAEEQRT